MNDSSHYMHSKDLSTVFSKIGSTEQKESTNLIKKDRQFFIISFVKPTRSIHYISRKSGTQQPHVRELLDDFLRNTLGVLKTHILYAALFALSRETCIRRHKSLLNWSIAVAASCIPFLNTRQCIVLQFASEDFRLAAKPDC